MDCEYVNEHHVVDRYLLNQLTAEERERFEDHYMSCDACLDAIERAEAMARGFKRVAAEEIVTAGAMAAGVAWWRRQRVWMGGAVTALAVAVALPLLLDDASGPTGEFRANTPVVYLQPERSAEAAPSHQIRLPAEPDQIVLVLELDPPFYPSYRAVVERDGRSLLEIEGLRLGERDSITLSLDSRSMAPGDHLLRLDASDPGGARVTVGQFAFRVLAD